MDDFYAAPKAVSPLQSRKQSLLFKALALPFLVPLAIICFNVALAIPYFAPHLHLSKSWALTYLISLEVLAAVIASLLPAWVVSRLYENRALLIGTGVGLSVAIWNRLIFPIQPVSTGMTLLVITRTVGITLFIAIFSELFARRHKL